MISSSSETLGVCRCPACDNFGSGTGIRVPDHEYGLSYVATFLECGACGTFFQVPMPTAATLSGYYPNDYHSMTHAGFLNRVRNTLRIRRLGKLTEADGPILDFGCGDGAFLLQAAKSMGTRPLWGFEIAEKTTVQELCGGRVRVVRGEFRDLLEVLPMCSVITMNHVIEHLPNPHETVKALGERLMQGGILEGQTPAANSLERLVFRSRWSGFHAPRHTVIFSTSGLVALLKRSGLPAATTQVAFNPAGIAVSLGSLAHKGGGAIKRSGVKWLGLVGMAALFAPIDICSGRPGIVNFMASRQ